MIGIHDFIESSKATWTHRHKLHERWSSFLNLNLLTEAKNQEFLELLMLLICMTIIMLYYVNSLKYNQNDFIKLFLLLFLA